MEQPAKRISNFLLGQQVHGGQRCEVFEARYTQAGGVVQAAVVKVLKPEYACIGEELRAFLREIDWARGLRHSLFPKVIEAGEDQGRYFLAMERLEGWTLGALLRELRARQVPMSAAVALTMLHQAADGLESVHGHCVGDVLGVVHLGIEPSNIMLRKDGMTAVLDFGEAMSAGDVDRTPTTTAGAYQAPERLRREPLDCRADVYSLGKVLEEMVACMDPAELGNDLPALIAQASANQVEERFASMREFMDAIELVADTRELEFSCHTCSRLGTEIFGDTSELRTDPRSSRPLAQAAPLRMQSEGMATAHGLPPNPAPEQDELELDELEELALDDLVELDAADLEPEVAAIEPTEKPKGKPRFLDAHLAVTTLGGPLTPGHAPAPQAAENEDTVEAATRKAWPQETVATKVYSQEPEDDDELASAIERLRQR